jgi:hypothetical protein
LGGGGAVCAATGEATAIIAVNAVVDQRTELARRI